MRVYNGLYLEQFFYKWKIFSRKLILKIVGFFFLNIKYTFIKTIFYKIIFKVSLYLIKLKLYLKKRNKKRILKFKQSITFSKYSIKKIHIL